MNDESERERKREREKDQLTQCEAKKQKKSYDDRHDGQAVFDSSQNQLTYCCFSAAHDGFLRRSSRHVARLVLITTAKASLNVSFCHAQIH